MAEDIGSLEAEVRSLAGRRSSGSCGVCKWISLRADAAEWDRLMALPYDDSPDAIQHQALGAAMRKRDFRLSDHRIGAHRRERHRVA
jgi:hypothetical protein